MDIEAKLKNVFKGEFITDEIALDTASHDASLFELKPEIVAVPKDSADIQALVKYVVENKKNYQTYHSLYVQLGQICRGEP